MYLATEVWPTSMPSLRSSPWMRGAPQSGLARLIFRISRRISGGTLGLPARRRDFQRQKERKPARCHRITVSGSTIVSASKIRGAIRYKQTKIIRSKLLKTGRRGDARRSTFSWWRRASISSSSEVFDRNSPRSIHLIRLSRARIEHSSPDSDVHAKRTEFTTATPVHAGTGADARGQWMCRHLHRGVMSPGECAHDLGPKRDYVIVFEVFCAASIHRVRAPASGRSRS